MNMTCKCEVCERARVWKARNIPEDIIDYIYDLEMDVYYWKAIKSGTWPQGKEILLKYLENYK